MKESRDMNEQVKAIRVRLLQPHEHYRCSTAARDLVDLNSALLEAEQRVVEQEQYITALQDTVELRGAQAKEKVLALEAELAALKKPAKSGK